MCRCNQFDVQKNFISTYFLLLVTSLEVVMGQIDKPQELTTCRLENALLFESHCIHCTKDYLIPNSPFACLQSQNKRTDFLMTTRKQENVEPVINFEKFFASGLDGFKERPFVCCMSEPLYSTLKQSYTASLLNARQMRIVTIVRPPFVTTNDNEKFGGVIFELLQAIQIKYNFSMNTHLPFDGNWGSKFPNGSWNGMIGMVRRNETDIGAAGFSVTVERARAIHFTMAFHQEPSAILIPPPVEAEKLSVLIRPLSKQVWSATLCTIFILIPSLYAFHRASIWVVSGGNSNLFPIDCTAVLSNLVWFIIGSILQQGLISPVEKSTRFVTCIWWFVTLILANIYVAFLVSYLSTPQLYNIVDSLEDLSRQSKIKWTFRSNTAHRNLFKGETSLGTYKIIGDKTPDTDLVMKDVDGVTKVLEGKFAFIKEKSFLDVAIGDDFEEVKKCRMTLAKETFFTVGVALVVAKKSPWLNLLNYEISNAIASGVMEKWKTNSWPKRLWCTDAAHYIISTRPKTRKLTLNDVQGAYFLFSLGIFFSILAFFLEQFNYRAYDKNRKDRLFINTWKFQR